MPYFGRHGYVPRSSPPSRRYSRETWKEYTETPLAIDEHDDARLQVLKQRFTLGALSQAEQGEWDHLLALQEERADAKCAALGREIEGYFAHLDLAPPPAPLPKSSLWLDITHPKYYKPAEIRSFYLACQEGNLDEVRDWVRERKDELQPIGIRDGLDCAAMGGQVAVARHLLEEAGARVSARAVIAACDRRDLGLFELFLRHGYHPDQQVPSNSGHFGTALLHVLDNDAIALLLLEHGADPNSTPIMDGRRSM
ncbi:hypothetical protein IMZ48_17690, partial [Candidatus Bathyarchaeota archaeon]|nr:hypothetical protein [Candidatus Bathyarchaeota archaeon]